jgi:hypothetical protein
MESPDPLIARPDHPVEIDYQSYQCTVVTASRSSGEPGPMVCLGSSGMPQFPADVGQLLSPGNIWRTFVGAFPLSRVAG